MSKGFIAGDIFEVVENQYIDRVLDEEDGFENVYLGEEVSHRELIRLAEFRYLSYWDTGFTLLFPKGTRIMILGRDVNGNVGFEVINNPELNSFNKLFDMSVIVGAEPLDRNVLVVNQITSDAELDAVV